jgi:hypothetical protein
MRLFQKTTFTVLAGRGRCAWDGVREGENWRGCIHELVLEDLEGRGNAFTIVRAAVEERAARVRQGLGAARQSGPVDR